MTEQVQMERGDPFYHWQQEAACINVDTDVFFPEAGRNTAAVEVAKAICRECVVKPDCLEEAIITRDQYAIRGGTTPIERKVIIRRRSRRGAAA